MPRRSSYYTLMSSLPHMPATFEVRREPISQPRLESRLGMLSAEDARLVWQLDRFLRWERQTKEETDEDVLRAYDEILETIEYPLAREIVIFFMDVRTIVAALRLRKKGLPPPLGVGQWVGHIARNWHIPDFHLGLRHPWVDTFRSHMEAGEVIKAHRCLLNVIWNHFVHLADRYFFDFEAVMIYLVRWGIINSWVRQDRAEGEKRFDELVKEAMGEYGELFR